MAAIHELPLTSERARRLPAIADRRCPGETDRAALSRRLLADTVATLAAVAAAYYDGDIARAKASIYGKGGR